MSSSVSANGLDDRSRGLFARTWLNPDGTESRPVVTNIRLAGTRRRPGSGLINTATTLLFLLALGLFVVSARAQYSFVLHQKPHQQLESLIEAVSLDLGMSIFSLLGLGLARAGKPAAVERVLVLACAAGSAAMNYAAANVLSPRSVVVYVLPPVFLALVVDRVVSVVRRHVLGDDQASPWSVAGRAALYLLRLVVAPVSTLRGGRLAILSAAPVPVAAVSTLPEVASPVTGPPSIDRSVRTRAAAGQRRGKRNGTTKTSQLLAQIEAEHGPLKDIDPSRTYAICKATAPAIGLHEGSARTALATAIKRAREGAE